MEATVAPQEADGDLSSVKHVCGQIERTELVCSYAAWHLCVFLGLVVWLTRTRQKPLAGSRGPLRVFASTCVVRDALLAASAAVGSRVRHSLRESERTTICERNR